MSESQTGDTKGTANHAPRSDELTQPLQGPSEQPPSAPLQNARRVALFPPKDVAFFLPKEQGKETEAVSINVRLIKRKQR